MIGHRRRDSGPVDSSRRANDEKTKHAGEIAGAQEQENSVKGVGKQDHRGTRQRHYEVHRYSMMLFILRLLSKRRLQGCAHTRSEVRY